MRRYWIDVSYVVVLSLFTTLAIVVGATWAAGTLVAMAYFGGRLTEQRLWHHRVRDHNIDELEAFTNFIERALAADEVPEQIADEVRADYQRARQELARLRR